MDSEVCNVTGSSFYRTYFPSQINIIINKLQSMKRIFSVKKPIMFTLNLQTLSRYSRRVHHPNAHTTQPLNLNFEDLNATT